jgi:glutaryl-CoA dehydrogenase
VQNCQIYFEDVQLPEKARLPLATSYRDGIEQILTFSRFNIIFIAFGACLGVYRAARTYAVKREQFGQPIAGFQLVQEKLVKIMATTQAIGTVCYRIAELQQSGQTTLGLIAMFKAWVTERARAVTRWGREVMGGNGITHDHFVMKAITDI